MNITSLADNYVKRTGLLAEHGFSVLLDTGTRKILIDTGQSSAFIKNAQILGIKLEEVDILIITHGHYDHTGGASAFLSINKQARVYAKNGLFKKRFHGENKYIGVPEDLWHYRDRFVFLNTSLKIDDKVHIITEITDVYPDDMHADGLNISNGDRLIQDHFDDELFVVIEEDEYISVLSACSHRGISNITDTAVRLFNKPVRLILGGFHLKNESAERIKVAVDRLLSFHPDLLAVSHCTGLNAFMEFTNRAPQKTFYFATGDTVTW